MTTAPGALVWAGPILAGLLLAIPFAAVTTSRTIGRLLTAGGLCATPEELSPPAEVRVVCGWLSTSPVQAVSAYPHPYDGRTDGGGGVFLTGPWVPAAGAAGSEGS
jgi:membrane glycosyltransferase